MERRHLFLYGGSPPFGNKLGKQFAHLASRREGRVAILFIEREGWQAYMPKYTKVLEQQGIIDFNYLPLSPTPSKKALEQLDTSSGIIIGGGNTELYRKYIVNTLIGEQIQFMYEGGVPVAGFSAGALISPKNCVISPMDNSRNKQLFEEGLGLISNCIISVHFTKWGERENLMFALKRAGNSVGYGIDDGAGIYFINETLHSTEGEAVHIIKRKDTISQ